MREVKEDVDNVVGQVLARQAVEQTSQYYVSPLSLWLVLCVSALSISIYKPQNRKVVEAS